MKVHILRKLGKTEEAKAFARENFTLDPFEFTMGNELFAQNYLMTARDYAEAEQMCTDYCFPNKLEDIAVLDYAVREFGVGMAAYYLGNL